MRLGNKTDDEFLIKLNEKNSMIQNIFNEKMLSGGLYKYDFILGVTEARNLPIVNYSFDNTSENEAESRNSIIIRLNSQLPASTFAVSS